MYLVLVVFSAVTCSFPHFPNAGNARWLPEYKRERLVVTLVPGSAILAEVSPQENHCSCGRRFFPSSFNIEEIQMNIKTLKLLTSKQNLWNRRKMVYLKKSLFELRLNKNSSHFKKQTKKIKENRKSVKYIKGVDRRMLSWINSCNRFALLKFSSLYWNFFLNVPFFSIQVHVSSAYWIGRRSKPCGTPQRSFFLKRKATASKVTFRCAKHMTNLIFIHILDTFINGLYFMLDIKKRWKQTLLINI